MGDIDGDAPVALLFELVHDKGELHFLALGFRRLPEDLHPVRRQAAGIIKEPPDEGALAVVHMAGNDNVH